MALLEVSFPEVSGLGLSVRRFHAGEALSTTFQVALTVTSPHPDLDFEQIVGSRAYFRVDDGPLGARTWEGLCTSMEQTKVEESGLSTYEMTIEPHLWQLTKRRNHRVFSHLSAVEIAQELLTEWAIEHELRLVGLASPKLEYRVQHGESDFDFLSRLLEDAGISFYFVEAEGDGDKGPVSLLVLSDEPQRGDPTITLATCEPLDFRRPCVAHVQVGGSLRTGSVIVADYDHRNPRYIPSYQYAAPNGAGTALESYEFSPGSALIDTDAPAGEVTATPFADGYSRARLDDRAGRAQAERMLQSRRQDALRIAFATSTLAIAPGTVFRLEDAPLVGSGALVARLVQISGDTGNNCQASVEALPADQPVRPIVRTTRPRLFGVEHAVVVGPPGEEVHTDEFGRVRVRFFWDREGELDDRRTCWVRVVQGAAGAGFGMIALPRVGQEIVVGFYAGDPDQPLVLGRLYDVPNPTPEPLPGKNATSTLRTRSTPVSEGHHELSMDDTANRESYLIRSERNLEAHVTSQATETTAGNRATTVGGGDSLTVGATQVITAGGMHAVRIAKSGGDRNGAAALTPGATLREIISERILITSGGTTFLLDGPDITVTAQKDILIKSGATLSIQGEQVQINPPIVSSGPPAAAPPMPSNLVWFKLASAGNPMAGVRCHLELADGTVSTGHVTDGQGLVRVPIDKPGVHKIRLGDPPDAEPAAAAPAAEEAVAAPAADPPVAKAAEPLKLGNTPSQATRTAAPTAHNVNIKVEIKSPIEAEEYVIDPGTFPGPAPKMPTIPLHARVTYNDQELTAGTVTWEATISGKHRVRRSSAEQQRMNDAAKAEARRQSEEQGKTVKPKAVDAFNWVDHRIVVATVTTKPNEQPDLPFSLVMGGKLEVRARYVADPSLGGASSESKVTCRIKGKNPAKRDLQAYISHAGTPALAWLFLRLCQQESINKQFNSSPGKDKAGNDKPRTATSDEPNYGAPAGVGLFQQDPEWDEWGIAAENEHALVTSPNKFFPHIFWDWRKNVESGIAHFNTSKLPAARNALAFIHRTYPDTPAPPEELVYREAIRRYNGFGEYTPAPDGRHYQAVGRCTVNRSAKPPRWTISASMAGEPAYVQRVLDQAVGDYPIPEIVTYTRYPR